MSTVLEISGVDQSFRVGFWMKKVEVLHDIHLTVPEKAVFGFLGANGAGKTTLIHLITGLRKPTRGQVLLRGLDATSREAKSKIGYLPERPYFHEHLTATRLLNYFGALAGLSRVQVRSRIPVVLSQVGMSGAKDLELRCFSKGMLQRIGIAQALIHDPEFLVLDEPMSGLDPIGRKEIRELIMSLAAEGRTILFSSHVIPDVEAICNQVALIQKGKLIGFGPLENFLQSDTDEVQTEVAFSSLSQLSPGEWPEFKSLRQTPQAHIAVVSGQADIHRVLSRLLQMQAVVLWVTPIRRSLETLFTIER